MIVFFNNAGVFSIGRDTTPQPKTLHHIPAITENSGRSQGFSALRRATPGTRPRMTRSSAQAHRSFTWRRLQSCRDTSRHAIGMRMEKRHMSGRPGRPVLKSVRRYGEGFFFYAASRNIDRLLKARDFMLKRKMAEGCLVENRWVGYNICERLRKAWKNGPPGPVPFL